MNLCTNSQAFSLDNRDATLPKKNVHWIQIIIIASSYIFSDSDLFFLTSLSSKVALDITREEE